MGGTMCAMLLLLALVAQGVKRTRLACDRVRDAKWECPGVEMPSRGPCGSPHHPCLASLKGKACPPVEECGECRTIEIGHHKESVHVRLVRRITVDDGDDAECRVLVPPALYNRVSPAPEGVELEECPPDAPEVDTDISGGTCSPLDPEAGNSGPQNGPFLEEAAVVSEEAWWTDDVHPVYVGDWHAPVAGTRLDGAVHVFAVYIDKGLEPRIIHLKIGAKGTVDVMHNVHLVSTRNLNVPAMDATFGFSIGIDDADHVHVMGGTNEFPFHKKERHSWLPPSMSELECLHWISEEPADGSVFALRGTGTDCPDPGGNRNVRMTNDHEGRLWIWYRGMAGPSHCPDGSDDNSLIVMGWDTKSQSWNTLGGKDGNGCVTSLVSNLHDEDQRSNWDADISWGSTGVLGVVTQSHGKDEHGNEVTRSGFGRYSPVDGWRWVKMPMTMYGSEGGERNASLLAVEQRESFRHHVKALVMEVSATMRPYEYSGSAKV